MATWEKSDFDREAAAIARAFWAGHEQNGAPLSEIATKTARDNGLNPEQIRRLCRQANTKAFEQKHAALKGAEDRTPNFELADPESVIASLHNGVRSAHTKEAAAEYPDLSDEFRPAPRATDPGREKVAALTSVIDESLPARRSPLVALRRAEKTAEALRMERHALNFAWDEALSKIAAQTKFLHWDHDTFEKNAVALHGADVLPELNAVRQRCGLPPLGDGIADAVLHSKLAALQDEWLGVADEFSSSVEGAMRVRVKFAEVVRQQDRLIHEIEQLKKVVRHA